MSSRSDSVGSSLVGSLIERGRNRLLRRLSQSDLQESAVLIITALIVGIGAGLGAVVFIYLVQVINVLSFEVIGALLQSITPYQLVLIPASGGLIVGYLTTRFAPKAKGHGVPEVMEAVALRGGRIRSQVAIIKTLASGVTIGTGGSSGAEGPIAQIGAAIGSTLGQILHLSDGRTRNLVACGVGGGIAAIFNAPIGGAMFALEVIHGQFHAVYFGSVVISAVTADVVVQMVRGNQRILNVPQYFLVNPLELILYGGLGLLAAVGAVVFIKILYAAEDFFERLPLSPVLKPAIGGALLGVVGILVWQEGGGTPQIFGAGYTTISSAVFGRLAFQVAMVLFIAKLLATILTLGSGGSGGIFAPSLFMGAMLGQAYGQAASHLIPFDIAPSGAYALVGMSALFAGAAHAPVTAILLLFEMTGDYRIILPLMLATVLSTLVSRIIHRESIYTLKLRNRGIQLNQGKVIDVMQGVLVGEVMTRDVDTVPLDMSLNDLAVEFSSTHHHGFPVVDNQNNLIGLVTIQDLDRAFNGGNIMEKTVGDIATKDGLIVAYPDEPVWEALRRLGLRDVGRLPVLESEDSRRIVGLIRRSDIVRAYNVAIVNRANIQHQTEVLQLGRIADTTFVHITIPGNSIVAEMRVGDIQFPVDCLIVSIQRDRKQQIVHGDSVLKGGDRITVFTDEKNAEAVREYLHTERD